MSIGARKQMITFFIQWRKLVGALYIHLSVHRHGGSNQLIQIHYEGLCSPSLSLLFSKFSEALAQHVGVQFWQTASIFNFNLFPFYHWYSILFCGFSVLHFRFATIDSFCKCINLVPTLKTQTPFDNCSIPNLSLFVKLSNSWKL